MMFKLKSQLIFSVCLLLTSVIAQSLIHEKDSRTFTSNDGREITAQLEGYNQISKEVTLRIGSGQKHYVHIDRLSRHDQAFILV